MKLTPTRSPAEMPSSGDGSGDQDVNGSPKTRTRGLSNSTVRSATRFLPKGLNSDRTSGADGRSVATVVAICREAISGPVPQRYAAPVITSWRARMRRKEGSMISASKIRRCCVLLALALISAGMIPGSAFGNAQGARVVAAAGCPEGLCVIRATRTWMVRSSASWVIPTTTAAVEWIAADNAGPACGPDSCIVQQGYGKWTASAEPNSCAAATTDVKQFYYSIDASGDATCEIGQLISPSEGHTQKVSRCNGSDWCTYFDGDFKFEYTNSGIGSTAPLAVVSGEFTCDSCQTSTTVMRASYGAGSTSNPNWQISDAGDGSDFAAVQNSDTSTQIFAFCSGTSNSKWVVNNVSTSSMWDVYWSNGGTNC